MLTIKYQHSTHTHTTNGEQQNQTKRNEKIVPCIKHRTSSIFIITYSNPYFVFKRASERESRVHIIKLAKLMGYNQKYARDSFCSAVLFRGPVNMEISHWPAFVCIRLVERRKKKMRRKKIA